MKPLKSSLLEQLTATDAKKVMLTIDTIITKGLQTRERTDPTKVAEYAEIYRAGGSMPPIVVFSDGGDEFYLGDGQHRVAGARKAELAEIEGIIKKGDRRAALWYATAANAQHGLARTNEDKRRAVELILADEEWRTLSDAAIAEHAQVSDRLVAKVRKAIGATAPTRTGKDGKTRTTPAAKTKAATPNGSGLPKNGIQRELMGDGDDGETSALDDFLGQHGIPDLPPGIYLDVNRESECSEFYTLISSEPAGDRLAQGTHIRTSYGSSGIIDSVTAYRTYGCLVYGVAFHDPKNKHGGGTINELVFWNGELRKLFANNKDRISLDGTKPKTGTDDTAELRRIGKPLPRPQRAAPATTSSPDPGPEEVSLDADRQATATNVPALADAPITPTEIAHTPFPKPDPKLRPLGLRRVDHQRGLIAVELTSGKPRWTGTDADLFCLALICGTPTRSLAWIDSVRAQARDLFIDGLRTEVAERIRSGEAANTPKWPSIRELCALWGLDFASIEIRAERAVPE